MSPFLCMQPDQAYARDPNFDASMAGTSSSMTHYDASQMTAEEIALSMDNYKYEVNGVPG